MSLGRVLLAAVVAAAALVAVWLLSRVDAGRRSRTATAAQAREAARPGRDRALLASRDEVVCEAILRLPEGGAVMRASRPGTRRRSVG